MANKYIIRINPDKVSGELIVEYRVGIWPFRKTNRVVATLKYARILGYQALKQWVLDDGSEFGVEFFNMRLTHDDYKWLQKECEYISGQRKRPLKIFREVTDLPEAKVINNG